MRRGEIEKKALLRRIEEMRQAGNDPIADMVTGSLPDSTHRRRQPAIARDAAQTRDGGIRDALHRSMQADLAYAKARVSETQFAVEVATARSLSELRAHWDALAAKHTGIVGDLEPVVRVRETGAGLSLHLLAGPVRNAADAVDLCVRLRSTGALCAAVPYDGQRLE